MILRKNRCDGAPTRDNDPTHRMLTHILPTRSESQVVFTEKIDLTKVGKYLSEKRAEGLNVSFLSILMASLVKLFYEKEEVNRFIHSRRLYLRNHMSISIVMKRQEGKKNITSTQKLFFDQNDCIVNITKKLNDTITSAKDSTTVASNADGFSKALDKMPHFLLKFFVEMVKTLDNSNLLPKFIMEMSPFHSSVFITDIGSLGLNSINHHLYNFGTTSFFISMGKKYREVVLDKNNEVHNKMFLDLSFTVDERITNGDLLANAVRRLVFYITHPERLEKLFIDSK